MEQINLWMQEHPMALPCFVGAVFMGLGLYFICMAFMPDLRPKRGLMIRDTDTGMTIKAGPWMMGLIGVVAVLSGLAAFSTVNETLRQWFKDWLPILLFVVVGSLILTMKVYEWMAPSKPRSSGPTVRMSVLGIEVYNSASPGPASSDQHNSLEKRNNPEDLV